MGRAPNAANNWKWKCGVCKKVDIAAGKKSAEERLRLHTMTDHPTKTIKNTRPNGRVWEDK